MKPMLSKVRNLEVFYILMAKISMDIRMLVVRKMNEGWSQRMIANFFNISTYYEEV